MRRMVGTKTREWQLDVVLMLERAEREGSDISFLIDFDKAKKRECTPDNRADFRSVRIWLTDDQWRYKIVASGSQNRVPPETQSSLRRSKPRHSRQRFEQDVRLSRGKVRGVESRVHKARVDRPREQTRQRPRIDVSTSAQIDRGGVDRVQRYDGMDYHIKSLCSAQSGGVSEGGGETLQNEPSETSETAMKHR